MNAILDERDRRQSIGKVLDNRHLAYMLGTVFHETGGTMQPVTENLTYSAERIAQVWPSRFRRSPAPSPSPTIRASSQTRSIAAGWATRRPDDGYAIAAADLPQITGKDNYKKLGLADAPETAAEMPTAIRILFDGMIRGMFTGQKHVDYFNQSTTIRSVPQDHQRERQGEADCRLLSQLPRRARGVAGADRSCPELSEIAFPGFNGTHVRDLPKPTGSF